MCEMDIQLCVISVELEINTKMILYDFTQRSNIEYLMVLNYFPRLWVQASLMLFSIYVCQQMTS